MGTKAKVRGHQRWVMQWMTTGFICDSKGGKSELKQTSTWADSSPALPQLGHPGNLKPWAQIKLVSTTTTDL